MPPIANYNRTMKDSRGTVWKHKTGKTSVYTDKVATGWRVAYVRSKWADARPDEVIKFADTRDEARKAAVSWMESHPQG